MGADADFSPECRILKDVRKDARNRLMEQTREDIVQNLMDVGLSQEQIEKCMKQFDEESYQQVYTFLRGARCDLLEGLHDSQRKLEQLDFLLYHLKKKSQVQSQQLAVDSEKV